MIIYLPQTSTHSACWFVIAIAVISIPLHASENRDVAPIDFAQDVLPLLSNKCFVCHGPDGRAKDVLRLDSFAEATRDLGGRRAIEAERPAKSAILARIHSTDDPMPPVDAEKQLTQMERELLSHWVRQGGKYTPHWAFVPPKKTIPPGSVAAMKSEVIDAFVSAHLEERGIEFAPQADRATLARRAALVLTGLPPKPHQLTAFLASEDNHAYGRLVDELLDSPRYGEHQARYWLDAVRYGDTHGLHLDNRRAIFPYRDWVVKAMNDNLPWDDFITWQIAGDLLPNSSLAQLVATGYVRLNPSSGEGGAISAEFQMKNNFDRVETLGTVFLGMSLTCARCHSHKYDPIPQTEYYRLLAFFNSTAESALDGNAYDYGPVVKSPPDQVAWQAWQKSESDRAKLFIAAQEKIKALKLTAEEARKWKGTGPRDRLLILADPAGPFAELPLQKQASELAERIATAEANFTTSLVAQDLPQPRQTHVLRRGEYDQPIGDSIKPGYASVMGYIPDAAPRNRLDLARWLTSRGHPLVARVLINRIWQQTFGHGLVRTPEDFGLQGEYPTHPKLLDWLAVEFHDSGWDLKHMLRLMVSSQTFRQTSAWRHDLEDPENRLLTRGPRHRLDAEVLRDVGLSASGLLDSHMGGEGIKPYQPKGLWAALMHPSSNTKNYVPDKGQRLYRRSLYVYWKRTSPHPMMTLFDAPERESSCVERSRSNTPLQSLGLLNEIQRIEMSRMLAQRLMREGRDDTERLDLLFTLLTCRKPADYERAACTKLLTVMRERYADAEHDARALLSVGDTPRDESFAPAEHAAWTQVAITVLGTDVSILLY